MVIRLEKSDLKLKQRARYFCRMRGTNLDQGSESSISSRVVSVSSFLTSKDVAKAICHMVSAATLCPTKSCKDEPITEAT